MLAKLRSSMRSMLRSILDRGRMEKAMDSELRFHIESYTEDLVRGGMNSEEAARRARIEFGGVEAHKEECRDSLGLRLWDELRADLRFAVRTLRQSPGFTAIAVTSLALGIGANTAIFTLTQEVLLKQAAVPNADRLRLLEWIQTPKTKIGSAWGMFLRDDQGRMTGTPFTYQVYRELRQHNQALEDLVAFKDLSRLAVNTGHEAESLDGELVSGNYFRTLGAPLIAGRGILPDDDTPAAAPVTVISDGYWASRFGRSAGALGQTIRVNDLPVTIVGVTAPRFRGMKTGFPGPEVFLPMSVQPRVIPRPSGSLLTNPNFSWVIIAGRLKPGESQKAAEAAMNVIFRNAVRATVPGRKEEEIAPVTLIDGARGLDTQSVDFAKPILLLSGVAGLVLLIACANLANLLLARAAARQREMSVRLAMGAGKWRIIRQVMTESVLLALLGGSAGLAVGYFGRGFIPGLFEQAWSTATLVPDFNWRVFAFGLGVSLLTGLLFGVAPAWRSTRADVNVGLKESSRMTSGRSRALAGKSLVVFQVSLSALLLIGAGLFLRTLANLRHVSVGFNPEHLLLFEVDPPKARYNTAQMTQLFRRMEERLAALPGIQWATLSSDTLLANELDNTCFRPGGRPLTNDRSKDMAMVNVVGRDFLQAMGIPLLAGRTFSAADTRTSRKVAIVNKTLAHKFFPNQNPIGKTFEPSCEEESEPVEIIGISADARYNTLRDEPPATYYFPYVQADEKVIPMGGMTFELRTAASTASIVPAIREAVRSIDSGLPLVEVRTQMQQIDATMSNERVFAALTAGFGLLALLLACIGIYGIMAYTVARRTSEIGIRMALGARSREVLAMILKEASVLAGLGVALGIGASVGVTRLIASMLFGLKANDPVTLAAAGAVLLAMALVAGFAPAYRASRVDPMHALRHE